MILAARRLLACLCVMLGLSAPVASQDRATVFAAASLSGVLERIFPTDEVVLSYAGSGTIARQMGAGAPVDLIILANADWMNWLVEQRTIGADDPVIIATNQLVVVAAKGTSAPASIETLTQTTGRIAMGQRDAVPAGRYAFEWLTATGDWPDIAARVVETQNVRAALDLVARGATPYGIVYASDVARSDAVIPVLSVPADLHAPILYPAAALTPRGDALLLQLGSAKARGALRQAGFGPAP